MSSRFYINNGWLFTESFSEECLKPQSEENFRKVDLPATVKETPFNYFDESVYQMISGYVKKLSVPTELKGKNVRLIFEGVAHVCTVYINGIEKLTHNCGYTAFEVDITEEINECSELTISLKVDSRESVNVPPFGYVIDYMTYGGIYRDVYLEVSEKSYIKDLFLSSEYVGEDVFLKGEVTVCNIIKGQSLTLEMSNVELESKGGFHYFEEDAEEKTVSFYKKVTGVREWSIEDPFLYTVNVTLYNDLKVEDSRDIRFGFRKSEFKADGYYLNNKKVKIRGLNRHQSFPYTGYAMPDSLQREDVRILKEELGVNAVRTSHYPQSQAFYDACDELGLLVFTEIPGWQHIGDESWKDQAVKNTEDMILQNRNHPSVILWGVRINESADDDELYTRTNEAAHRLDPARPTGGVRALKKSHLLEDVYTYNDFVHAGDNIGCEDKKKVTPDIKKPYLISEYNGHMYPTKSYDWEEHRLSHAKRHAKVLDSVAGKENIAGSFGWCMFDYNTHQDFGSGDRICYHGVMDMFRNPKLASYVYACESGTPGSDPKCSKMKHFGSDLGCSTLEVSSTMDIGEHPGCNRGELYILSDADSVKMYKNNHFLKEYFPTDSPYKNLNHGPILVDDFVGSAIEENENYSKALSRDIKEMLNATARYGLSKLPKRIWWLAAKAMLFHHMTMGDAVTLYNKYVGDWGGTATVYKFEAIKDGKVVKTLIKEPVKEVTIKAEPSTTTLRPGKTYDVAAVRIQAVDQNGNLVPFFNEPLTLCTEGDIELIGPKTISLKGGMGGTYVRSNSGINSEGRLIIENLQCETVVIDFKTERDNRWTNLR